MVQKNYELDGNNNKRLTSSTPVNNEGTAALTNEKSKQKGSEMAIPSIENVIDAKEWVDNGSKL